MLLAGHLDLGRFDRFYFGREVVTCFGVRVIVSLSTKMSIKAPNAPMPAVASDANPRVTI